MFDDPEYVKLGRMKILGMDPGKDHFAYAYLEDGDIKEYGFHKEIGSLNQKDWPINKQAFIDNSLELFKKFPKTEKLIVERYLPRPGKGVGSVSEPINLMIGMLALISHNLFPMDIEMPSTWKNYMSRTHQIGKKHIISEMKKYLLSCDKSLRTNEFIGVEVDKPLKKHQISTHESDAIGIAVFAHEKHTKEQLLRKLRIHGNHLYQGIHMPSNPINIERHL